MQMRRWISILLLVVLPLQSSWAVAAAYCKHESGTAAQHTGHHDHKHQADAGHDDTTDSKPLGTIDNDCSACHAGCCSAAVPATTQGFHQPQALVAVDSYRHSLTTPPPSLPDRPNWTPLA